VTVEFPSGAVVESPVIEPDFGGSDDGTWRENIECSDAGCEISFVSDDGRATTVDGRYFVTASAWRPGSHAIAIGVSPGVDPPADRVIVIDDAALPLTRVVYVADDAQVDAFAWHGDALLVASRNDNLGRIEGVLRDGTSHLIADGLTPVPWLYPSPDGRTFAFTQSDAAGWRLFALDAENGAITDYGAMGSDGADAQPVTSSPENTGKGGPMAVAWSPDGSKLAFGGGFEPPYAMKIVDLRSGNVAHTEFPAGYPGEMRWNATGTQLAVSTYDPERTHHETWVVDASTGAGRHLMDGCIIVWSPDDRFLAVHGEDIIGMSIVDVTTAARMRLTQDERDTPLQWGAMITIPRSSRR
jgi:WD40 repeat protein